MKSSWNWLLWPSKNRKDFCPLEQSLHPISSKIARISISILDVIEVLGLQLVRQGTCFPWEIHVGTLGYRLSLPLSILKLSSLLTSPWCSKKMFLPVSCTDSSRFLVKATIHITGLPLSELSPRSVHFFFKISFIFQNHSFATNH